MIKITQTLMLNLKFYIIKLNDSNDLFFYI